MTRRTTGRLRRRSIARRLALAVVLAALFVPACGKKGPPRPPLVRAARASRSRSPRAGSGPVVYLQFQIPAANADGTTPADIERVEVYGFTGQPPGREDLFKHGTLVASVPVRKPAEESAGPEGEGGRGAGGPRRGRRPRRDRRPRCRPASTRATWSS